MTDSFGFVIYFFIPITLIIFASVKETNKFNN